MEKELEETQFEFKTFGKPKGESISLFPTDSLTQDGSNKRWCNGVIIREVVVVEDCFELGSNE